MSGEGGTLVQTYPGLRVLDLATNFAGPYAAMILGALGADVIKVERSPNGDDTRSLPPFVNGQSTVFMAVNGNKRSIMLDFKSAPDREILHSLIERADVLIESFPPGVGQKLSLNWANLSAVNPNLIMASITAFGSGPIGRNKPGYDALVQAVSGLMSLSGNPGERTARIAPSVVDLTTGMWTSIGIMGALARRASAGTGEHIETALIDTAVNLMNHQVLGYLATGEEPRKLGGGAPSAAPYGIYPTKDGEVLLATASEAQFERLVVALGLQRVGMDDRFGTMQKRLAHREELDQSIAAATSGKATNDLLQLLVEHRIPAGRVNSVAEAMNLDVMIERNLLSSDATAVPEIRLPFELGHFARRPAPRLDQDRAAILASISDKRE